MDNEQLKEFCLSLIYADNESEVLSILNVAGITDEEHYWRDYGDIESNYSVIGTQQSASGKPSTTGKIHDKYVEIIYELL